MRPKEENSNQTNPPSPAIEPAAPALHSEWEVIDKPVDILTLPSAFHDMNVAVGDEVTSNAFDRTQPECPHGLNPSLPEAQPAQEDSHGERIVQSLSRASSSTRKRRRRARPIQSMDFAKDIVALAPTGVAVLLADGEIMQTSIQKQGGDVNWSTVDKAFMWATPSGDRDHHIYFTGSPDDIARGQQMMVRLLEVLRDQAKLSPGVSVQTLAGKMMIAAFCVHKACGQNVYRGRRKPQ